MLFIAFEYYGIFLPAAILGYFAARKFFGRSAAIAFLAAASLVFYAAWSYRDLAILLLSIAVNYFVSSSFDRLTSRKKSALVCGIVFNVLLLAVFKYSGFVVDNVSILTGRNFVSQQIVLPLGISFFTFQKIAFLVSRYRDEFRHPPLVEYFLFVTFFPQLIAGPIVRHKEMMPQFLRDSNSKFDISNFAPGLLLFIIGFGKKVVLADMLSGGVIRAIQFSDVTTFTDAWGAALSYTFQLYFDFSGYVDMATGSALMLNIRFPFNFNSPYKALSIQDFWQRWHMTLGRFLREYIYIPLGGSRRSSFATDRNLLLTFFISGVWHGAGWPFMVWGLWHGCGMVIQRHWRQAFSPLPAFAGWLSTFLFVVVGWVFFMSPTLQVALNLLQAMLTPWKLVPRWEWWNLQLYPPSMIANLSFLPLLFENGPASSSINWLMIIVAAVIAFAFKNSNAIAEGAPLQMRHVFVCTGVVVSLLVVVVFLQAPSQFIYFNF